MSLWSSAYEEATASLRSSSRSPVKELRSPDVEYFAGNCDGLLSTPRKVVSVDRMVSVEQDPAAGRTRLLGFERHVVKSRSTSPVRQPTPTIIQQISPTARRPLATPSHGSALSLPQPRAVLGEQWLVKNAFESWRSSEERRARSQEKHVVVLHDSERVRELEFLLVESDRKHAEILNAINSIQVKPDLGPLLEQVHVLRADLQELQTASSTQSEELQRSFNASETAMEKLLRRLFGELRVEMVGVRNVLSDKLREEIVSMERHVHSDLCDVKEDMKVTKESLASLNGELSQLQTDQSRVLSAVFTSGSDVMDTVKAAKPDQGPILEAIHSIKISDNSDVLAAMRKLKTDSDVSPAISALHVAVDSSHQNILAGIESSTRRIGLAIQDLSTQSQYSSVIAAIGALERNTLNAMRTIQVQANLDPVVRAIASADVDFEPILESVQVAKAEIQASNAAMFERLFQQSRQVFVQQRATPSVQILQPAFQGWRMCAAPQQTAQASPATSLVSTWQPQVAPVPEFPRVTTRRFGTRSASPSTIDVMSTMAD